MSEDVKDKEKKKPEVVAEGHVASVNYTGKLEDGEVFDTSEGREPLKFVVGSGQLIKGFDKGVVGMKVGEKKTVDIEPADAYGDRDEKRIQKVPRDMLPKEPEPKEGMMLTISTPQGQMFPAKIHKVEDKEVVLDMNHPLAGKKLKFEIEVIDIAEKSDDNKEGGCEPHSCGGSCGCE